MPVITAVVGLGAMCTALAFASFFLLITTSLAIER
jgi:hypothetical protein